MRIPSLYFLVIFFILLTMVTETVMFWVGFYYKLRKERKKIEAEKKQMQ